MEQIELPLEELITHRLPLEETENAINMLGNKGVLKAVITP